MSTPSHRLQNLADNFFTGLERRVAALAASGYDVIRLDAGSPDLPPPEPVIDSLACSARQPGAHRYTAHNGTAALREAWAELYRQAYGVELDAGQEVLPLMGSKEGIFHLIQAWIDPGELVLVPDPGYMTYSRGTLFAGGSVYPVPLLPENGHLPDLAAIPEEVAGRAKMLWLNYPNNPTAAVAGLDFFRQAVAFAKRHDILLCHDAAYTQVVFDGYRAPSLLEVPGAKEVSVEVNSLSKSHNMAGWRLGVATGNPQALAALFRLKSNLDSGHFMPVLQAAVTALGCDPGWIDARNTVYQGRRDVLVQGLHAVGLPAAVPRASIYVWCPVPPGWQAEEFAAFLLEQAQVAVTPGTVFGGQGEGYVRLSLTAAESRIQQAVERMLSLKSQFEGRSGWG